MHPLRTRAPHALLSVLAFLLLAAGPAAAQKSPEAMAAEKELADRLAAERAAQVRAAADQAEAARAAAEDKRRRQEAALVQADVDRVLQRAKSDYPVLAKPEGKEVLDMILVRYKELAQTGMYPGTAMVEAVAHHVFALEVRPKPAMQQAVSAPAAAPRSLGNCRWVSYVEWSCKPQ
jgi:hypothetical protein